MVLCIQRDHSGGQAEALVAGTQDDLLRDVLQQDAVLAANTRFLAPSNGYFPRDFVKHVSVMQGECAAIDLKSEPIDVVVSSQDATTCCIAVVRCLASERLFITHLDQPGGRQIAFVQDAVAAMTRPELWLVGGFVDGSRSRSSAQAAETVLWALHSATLVPIIVQLAMTGQLNTDVLGRPRTQSLVYDHGLRQVSPLARRIEGARMHLS
jgi:hypothetical protein